MLPAAARAALIAAVAASASCGTVGPTAPATDDAPRIVAMERTRFGGQLVVLAENGDRQTDLTPPADEPARDNSPVWSPDGRVLAFVSSRQREDLTRTSLWLVPARAGASPQRLTATRGDVVDRDPAWLPDGRGLVFSSNRAEADGTLGGASFDLWRLPLRIDDGVATAGVAVRLTSSASEHELHPSVSSDGLVVFARVDRDGTTSTLWTMPAVGGTPARLTDGPIDLTPSWSPDGRTIAFAAPQTSNPRAEKDSDLFLIDADGGGRRLLLEEMGDESGPVWSADGRYLFATSLYRSVDTGKPVLSSVVFIDLHDGQPEGKHVVRALHDSAGPVQRSSPALAPTALVEAALSGNKPYQKAVADAVKRYLLRRADELEEQGLLPER